MSAPERPGGTGVGAWYRVPVLVAALVASILASPLPARWLVREAPLASPDAILSLGSHEHERFPETASQSRRWPAAVVLLTRPRVLGRYNCEACPHRVGWLAALGVPAERVEMLSPPVDNTNDELKAAAAWLRRRNLTRLLIVTSPYHTRRVRILAHADLRGVHVGVVACRVPGGLAPLWWARNYDRFYVRYELAALVATWWRHGLMPWLPSLPEA